MNIPSVVAATVTSRRPPPTNYLYMHDSAPPDEPPPSYDDATQSAATPLLVGPPPGYGTHTAYSEHDPDLEESSVASSDIERSDASLSESIGQVLGMLIFFSIMYGFWRFINTPADPPNGWFG